MPLLQTVDGLFVVPVSHQSAAFIATSNISAVSMRVMMFARHVGACPTHVASQLSPYFPYTHPDSTGLTLSKTTTSVAPSEALQPHGGAIHRIAPDTRARPTATCRVVRSASAARRAAALRPGSGE